MAEIESHASAIGVEQGLCPAIGTSLKIVLGDNFAPSKKELIYGHKDLLSHQQVSLTRKPHEYEDHGKRWELSFHKTFRYASKIWIMGWKTGKRTKSIF